MESLFILSSIKNTTLEEKNTHMKHETTVERIGTNLVQFKAPEINNEWSDDSTQTLCAICQS